MKYKNIFFDFDGTLFDTIVPIQVSLNKTLKKFGFSNQYSVETTKSFVGKGSKYTLEKGLGENKVSEKKMDEMMKYYIDIQFENHLKLCLPFLNTVKTLKNLKNQNVKLFIVTNKPKRLFSSLINKFIPNIIDDSITFDDNFEAKPNPNSTNFLIKKYNLKKEDSLFVGDSCVDADTAKNVGIDFAYCEYGYDPIDNFLNKKIDYKFQDISDLLKL